MLQTHAHYSPGASGWIDQNLPYIFLISLFRLLLPLWTKGPLSPSCLLKYCIPFKAWVKWTVMQKYSPGNSVWKNCLIHYTFPALFHFVVDIATLTDIVPALGGGAKVCWDKPPKMAPVRTLRCFCSARRGGPGLTSFKIRSKRRGPKMICGAVLGRTSEIASIVKGEGTVTCPTAGARVAWRKWKSGRITQISTTKLISVEGFSVEFPLKWRQLWPIQYLHHLLFYILGTIKQYVFALKLLSWNLSESIVITS